jgi:hypothetical protein
MEPCYCVGLMAGKTGGSTTAVISGRRGPLIRPNRSRGSPCGSGQWRGLRSAGSFGEHRLGTGVLASGSHAEREITLCDGAIVAGFRGRGRPELADRGAALRFESRLATRSESAIRRWEHVWSRCPPRRAPGLSRPALDEPYPPLSQVSFGCLRCSWTGLQAAS